MWSAVTDAARPIDLTELAIRSCAQQYFRSSLLSIVDDIDGDGDRNHPKHETSNPRVHVRTLANLLFACKEPVFSAD